MNNMSVLIDEIRDSPYDGEFEISEDYLEREVHNVIRSHYDEKIG